MLLCNPMQEDSGDQEMVFYSGGESNAPTGVGFSFSSSLQSSKGLPLLHVCCQRCSCLGQQLDHQEQNG